MSVHPFRSRFVGHLFATSALLVMFSCGGGGDPQPPQSLQSVAGIWNGQLSVADSIVNDVSCLITEAGEGVCVLYDTATVTIIGGVQAQITVANGNQLSGSGTVYALPGYVLPDGSSTVASFTVTDGMVSTRNTMELMFSILGSSGVLTGSFDPAYDRDSSLELVAAVYSAFEINGESASFSINANGILFSQTASGCIMSGQVSVIDPAFNGYDVTITLTGCPGLNGDYAGFAVAAVSVEANDIFLFGVFNSTTALLGAPIKVNQPVTEITKLFSSDGNAFDQFGIRLAVNANTLVVGADLHDDNVQDSGSVYIFTADSAGNWSEQAKINASDPEQNDRFGWWLDVESDTALATALFDDNNGIDSGSAYIFTRDTGGVWSEQAKLLADDGATQDIFGISGALDGDLAVVGAYWNDVVGSNSGAAYVYSRDLNGNWAQEAKLMPQDAEPNAWFGQTVAIQGNTVVICATQDNGTGAAYVFERDLANNWTQTVKLVANDATSSDFFGRSVTIDQQTVIVGAEADDDNGSESGSAYVFTKDMTGSWSQQAKLRASDGAAGDTFGFSVDLDGNMAIVGARDVDGIGIDSGAAYLYERDPNGSWSQLSKIIASDEAAGDVFGYSVSLDGNTLTISAPGDDDQGTGSGSVYVYRLDN